MITLVLETNNSPENALDKDRTVLEQVQAVLKDNTDIEEPVFLIQGGLPRYLTLCNYITCSELNRQYFIVDVVSIAHNLVEVHCKEDYVGTWRTAIREQKAIIKRQETEYNLYLNDGSLKAYQNPHIITKEFPQGFTSPSYILVVAGKGPATTPQKVSDNNGKY